MTSPPSTKRSGSAPLRDAALLRLTALCEAIDHSDTTLIQAQDVFDLLSDPWGLWPTGGEPMWANDICDDGSPFEFSIAFDDGRPELRMLLEPQIMPITPTSSWEAGLRLIQRLRNHRGVDVDRFDAVRDLFAPKSNEPVRFLFWVAAVLRDPKPLFKVYLNPQVHGRERAPELLHEAMRRLGIEGTHPFIKDSTSYFALDLETTESARVKLYVPGQDDIDHLRAIAPASSARSLEQALASADHLMGPRRAAASRPILSCFSFRKGSKAPELTVHVPIRCHVRSDDEALQRISGLLDDMNAERLRRAVAAISTRSLSQDRGLITYGSVRAKGVGTRLTVYLAPQLYDTSAETRPPSRPASGKYRRRGP